MSAWTRIQSWLKAGRQAPTCSYKSHQWYIDAPPYKTATGGIDPTCAGPVGGALPCASDQLNGYYKYGEVGSVSQISRYGNLRMGLWHEWASANRYLYPTNPLTGHFGNLPSYREHFTTSSYQPFVEYAYQGIPKLTITGGFKFAQYVQDLTQYPDNGKTIGTPPNGAPAVCNTSSYHSPPSLAANYRITPVWAAYGQFSQGSVIPPSSVFDVKFRSSRNSAQSRQSIGIPGRQGTQAQAHHVRPRCLSNQISECLHELYAARRSANLLSQSRFGHEWS